MCSAIITLSPFKLMDRQVENSDFNVNELFLHLEKEKDVPTSLVFISKNKVI